jgi:hypothetical protein
MLHVPPPTDPEAFKKLPPKLKARLMDQRYPTNYRTWVIALVITLAAHAVFLGYLFLTGPGPRPVLVYLNLIDPAKAGKTPAHQPKPVTPQQRL